MGSDLIVDAVAATHDYGAPVIIVDIGTATTISTVDENGNYIGGAILPGARRFNEFTFIKNCAASKNQL